MEGDTAKATVTTVYVVVGKALQSEAPFEEVSWAVSVHKTSGGAEAYAVRCEDFADRAWEYARQQSSSPLHIWDRRAAFMKAHSGDMPDRELTWHTYGFNYDAPEYFVEHVPFYAP